MLRHRFVALLAVAAVALAAPALVPLRAQETPSDTLLTVQHYLKWEDVSDPQISPDGRQIVYTRRWVNAVEDRWESELWVMDAGGGRKRFLAKGSNARWAPDGTRIAYLADGEPSGTQIWVRWMDAEGAASQVTRVTEAPGNLRWAPDGRWIAFTMLVPERPEWKIALPAPPPNAKWTKEPRIIESMHFRADRRGFVKPGYTHLFVVSADGGAPRQLTSGKGHVGARAIGIGTGAGLAWTPDGKTIVFDGLMAEDSDTRYRESYLYAVDVAGGPVRTLLERKGFWTGPEISPDGNTIAFTGYEWTDQTYKAAELWVMGADGGGMRQLAAGLDRDPGNVTWAPDGSGLYFHADDRGSRNVWFAPLRGEPRQVTQGVHMLSLGSISRTGVAVGVRTAPRETNNVVRFELRRPSEIARLTSSNEAVLSQVRLGEVEEIWYSSTGGTRVQGWIVKPPSFDPAKKYPLILEIHGGPHAMYNVGFSYMFQNFAANGFVVLYTNPRGSTGYGTAFGNAIDDAYPSVDYDDLMAGVDAVIARGFINEGSMFVGGCSGGGVLSSWVIGHTDRFAAAAVRCPVTNWISFAGTTDIVLWGHRRFRTRFWEDPQKWLEHSSLMYVGNVRTPTVIMTGVLDLRTPMAQSEEYYEALKLRGVPTALLRFEEEYHGTGSKPSNFMRTQLYMMSWYKRWSRPAAATGARSP